LLVSVNALAASPAVAPLLLPLLVAPPPLPLLLPLAALLLLPLVATLLRLVAPPLLALVAPLLLRPVAPLPLPLLEPVVALEPRPASEVVGVPPLLSPVQPAAPRIAEQRGMVTLESQAGRGSMITTTQWLSRPTSSHLAFVGYETGTADIGTQTRTHP
jgi:hypothetical protein